MSTEEKVQFQLPDWFVEAIEAGDPLAGVPAKRGVSRLHAWSFPCRITPAGGHSSASFTGNLQNLSTQGLGFISRQELIPGEELEIRPADRPDAPSLRVRIMHCTGTIQGFKVGCSLVAARN